MSSAEQSDEQDVKAGIYRHFKGREYEVLGVARHSETGDELVVYRALYGERGLWLRPKAMFSEIIKNGGVTEPRFRWIRGPDM